MTRRFETDADREEPATAAVARRAAGPAEIVADGMTVERPGGASMEVIFEGDERLRERIPDLDETIDYKPIDDEWERALALCSSREARATTPRPVGYWLVGPTGCGKTVFAKALAAEIGAAYYEIQVGWSMDPSELIGFPVEGADKQLRYAAGPITNALRASRSLPVVIVLDEVNRAPASAKDTLFSALDQRVRVSLNAAGGAVVRGDADNIVSIATANEGPDYSDIETIDLAERGRLGERIEIDYVGVNHPEREAELITEHTPASEDFARLLVRAANAVRAERPGDDERRTDGIQRGVPTRYVIEAAAAATRYREAGIENPVWTAVEGAIVGKHYHDSPAESEVRSILRQHLDGVDPAGYDPDDDSPPDPYNDAGVSIPGSDDDASPDEDAAVDAGTHGASDGDDAGGDADSGGDHDASDGDDVLADQDEPEPGDDGGTTDDADVDSGDGGTLGADVVGGGGAGDPAPAAPTGATNGETARRGPEDSKSDGWNVTDDPDTPDERDPERAEETNERERNDAGAGADPLGDDMTVRDPRSDMADRDTRLESPHRRRRANPADGIRADLRDAGLIRETIEEFRSIKNKNDPRPARFGSAINRRARLKVNQGVRKARRRQYEREVDNVEVPDRVVGLAVDLSGTMEREGGRHAKRGVGLLARAAEQIGDDVAAVSFNGNAEQLITAAEERFRWDDLDSVGVCGGTPMFEGLVAAHTHMEHSNHPEQVLFVLCDGRPRRADDVVDLIETIRARGTTVVGIGMGPNLAESSLEYLFDDDYVLVRDFRDLPAALVDQYRATLETV